MSITITGQLQANRIRNTTHRLLAALCALSRHWRARLGAARRFFTAALTLFTFAACEGTGGTATAALASSTCPGSISLTWFITNAGGQFVSCAQAGATSVALRLQSRTGGTPVFTAFPCESSPGTTNVNPGLYDVAIELHDANGRRLATAPPQTSVAIAVGRTKVLAPTTFTAGIGGGNSPVKLTLEAENIASNCQPSSMGGAGITGTTITIVRDGGGCAPALLVRSRGGTQTGTYQVNCSSPQVAACIERDETLTTTGLAPGAYVVRVGGKVGAADCWLGEARLDVPASGQLQTKIALRRQSAPGC